MSVRKTGYYWVLPKVGIVEEWRVMFWDGSHFNMNSCKFDEKDFWFISDIIHKPHDLIPEKEVLNLLYMIAEDSASRKDFIDKCTALYSVTLIPKT